jgi:hypothetical protein
MIMPILMAMMRTIMTVIMPIKMTTIKENERNVVLIFTPMITC